MSEEYNLAMARTMARKYSIKYNTFWYVRKVSDTLYSPWAHDRQDGTMVETYYCGRVWLEDDKAE